MTLTKEWLLKTISELEEERDAIPGAVNEDAAMALAAMKLALASLEAEPVAFVMADDLKDSGIISTPAYRQLDEARVRTVGDVVALYTVTPAPVSVPDFGALTKCIVQRLVDYGTADDEAIASAEEFVYNACRAAMLQGAAGNSPAIPDGYALVPVEPTKEMIDAGWSYYMTTKSPSSIGVYGAMLAAAPQQEAK